MLNFPAERRQSDGRQDEYSAAARIDTSNLPDLARQEFKQEADVNYILSRFGLDGPQRQLVFGDVDFDIDLTGAHAAVSQARRAWGKMPDYLKEKYPSWQDLLAAIHSGELTTLEKEEVAVTTPTPTT